MDYPQRPQAYGFVLAALLLLCGTHLLAQTPTTAPADDLPEEFRLLSRLPQETKLRWRLLARNDKVREQEAEHPDVNAVQDIWHVPLRKGRHASRLSSAVPTRLRATCFIFTSRPMAIRKPDGKAG